MPQAIWVCINYWKSFTIWPGYTIILPIMRHCLHFITLIFHFKVMAKGNQILHWKLGFMLAYSDSHTRNSVYFSAFCWLYYKTILQYATNLKYYCRSLMTLFLPQLLYKRILMKILLYGFASDFFLASDFLNGKFTIQIFSMCLLCLIGHFPFLKIGNEKPETEISSHLQL